MFTGIIENTSELVALQKENTNIHYTFRNNLTSQLKVDQSVAHNGVCLTVVAKDGDTYTVTAIDETLKRTSLNNWKVGTIVNFERCTQIGSRLDGHIVQGHVDQIGICKKIDNNNGSWDFHFEYTASNNVTVEKGSITINGVSLTVVNSGLNTFSVSIIPYTFEHTSFRDLKVSDAVNLEFDIIGKYVAKLLEHKLIK